MPLTTLELWSKVCMKGGLLPSSLQFAPSHFSTTFQGLTIFFFVGLGHTQWLSGVIPSSVLKNHSRQAWRTYEMSRIEPRSAPFKVSTLPTVLLLQPPYWKLLMKIVPFTWSPPDKNPVMWFREQSERPGGTQDSGWVWFQPSPPVWN